MEIQRLIYLIFLISLCSSNNPPCSTFLSVDISEAYEFSNDSGIFQQDNVTYAANNYFIDDHTGKRLGCICNIKKCIRKCCGANYYMSDYKKCAKDNNNFDLSLYDETRPDPSLNLKDFIMLPGFNCPHGYVTILAGLEGEFFLQKNGSLYYKDEYWTALYDLDFYCIDLLNNEVAAFLCEKNDYEDNNEDDYQFGKYQITISIGTSISIILLFITFIIYLLVPEKNVHKLALMSYVFSLIGANIALLTVQLHERGFLDATCRILGYLIIFFFLTSLFWMNIMCIDMWIAFSGMKIRNNETVEKKTFIIYCLYAWGVPTVYTMIIILLNTYGDPDSGYYPEIGSRRCFLGGLATVYYFVFPTAILIGINVVLFILTTVRIQRTENEVSMIKLSGSKGSLYEDIKQKLNFYLKLIFAMGLNWILELVYWALEWLLIDVPTYVFFIMNLTNALYGVSIFMIFVLRKNIWKTLKKRFYQWFGKQRLAQSMK